MHAQRISCLYGKRNNDTANHQAKGTGNESSGYMCSAIQIPKSASQHARAWPIAIIGTSPCISTPAQRRSRLALPVKRVRSQHHTSLGRQTATYRRPVPPRRLLPVLLAHLAVREAERQILLCVWIAELCRELEVALFAYTIRSVEIAGGVRGTA